MESQAGTVSAPVAGTPAELAALTHAERCQLLQLTRQMAKCAEEGDWDRVALLDSERAQVLNTDPGPGSRGLDNNPHNDTGGDGACESNGSSPSGTEPDLTAELISADSHVLSLARKHRDELADEGSRLQAQHTARVRYADAQRLR